MTKILGENLPNIPWQDSASDAPVWRYDGNPVIKRNPIDNVSRVFNSAVVPYRGQYVGVFRGDTYNGIPYLFLGRSADGIDFTFDKDPIVFYNADGTVYRFEYAYDPRLVKLDDVYYVIWCNGYHGPTIGLGKTTDFKRFEMLEQPFLPCNRNGVLFPKKIDGEYVMLSRPSDGGHTAFGDIFLSRSKDLTYWGKHRHLLDPGWEWWQSLKVGAGCAPIETDEGWLLFFHGVHRNCNGYVYSMGAVLLDKSAEKIICRCGNFLLTPEADYETNGFAGNVIFPCSALTDASSGRIAVYYGAADSVVGLAFTEINRLIAYMKKYGR